MKLKSLVKNPILVVFVFSIMTVLLMAYQRVPNKKVKITYDSGKLTKAVVIFGIPNWAADYAWDGSQILQVGLTITLKDGRSFLAVQEHRNQPIGPGYLIYLEFPYPDSIKNKITFDNVQHIHVEFTASIGASHDGGNPSQCKFRDETVLQFTGINKNILSGYGEPRTLNAYVSTGNPSYTLKTDRDRPNFEYDISNSLKYPIQ